MGNASAVDSVVEAVVVAYGSADRLRWIHGQGSVFSGFTDDSDLDFIAVWDGPSPALSGIQLERSEWTETNGLVIEHGVLDEREVDILHIPLATFAAWDRAVSDGGGWQQHQWPLPLHAVAGLAYGVLLHDPAGAAAAMRVKSPAPTPALVDKLTHTLDCQPPTYLSELHKCVAHGDQWLHSYLSNELMRLVYLTWFAREGRFCPFPKRLSSWFDHFGLRPDLVQLDNRIWTAPTPASKTDLIEQLAKHVLVHDALGGPAGRPEVSA